MASVNPFLDVLQKQVQLPDQRQPVLDVLNEFATAIQENSANRLDFAIALGYPTNYGQEYRVVMKSRRTQYEHVLVRAYVPVTGRGMRLDFYDYSMLECPDVDAVCTALLQFLSTPQTRDAIETFAR